MDRNAVILFLALLTVATQISIVVGLCVVRLSKFRHLIVNGVGPVGLNLAAFVASGCMAGSLYLSEVAHFTPCKLCWYQRVAMYPIAVVLVVAVFRRDASPRFSMQVLAVIGSMISTYHILVERFPQLESSSCDPLNPCSLKWIDKFGYVTIPVMALTGFISIYLLLLAHAKSEDNSPIPSPGV